MKKGIIALPTILLVSGIVLEISIALALISFFLLQSGAGVKFSLEALASAQGGIDDAIIRIVRNKDLGGLTAYSYTLTMDNRHQANIVICKNFKIANNSCDINQQNPGKTDIISLGKVFGKNRRLEAFVNVNSATGEVKVESIREISI